MKITVCGSGAVGSTTAWMLAHNTAVSEVILSDRQPSKARVIAQNLAASAAASGNSTQYGADPGDYTATVDSAVIVAAVGPTLTPTMGIAETLELGAQAIASSVPPLISRSPDAVLVCVTGPAVAAQIAWETSGLRSNRVLGTTAMAVSSRFELELATRLGVSATDVTGQMLGIGGRFAIPIESTIRVEGQPLPRRLLDAVLSDSAETARRVAVEAVRAAGGRLPFLAADNAALLVKDVLSDSCALRPIVTKTDDHYGLGEQFLGVVTRVGRAGIHEIIEVPMDETELDGMRSAAERQHQHAEMAHRAIGR